RNKKILAISSLFSLFSSLFFLLSLSNSIGNPHTRSQFVCLFFQSRYLSVSLPLSRNPSGSRSSVSLSIYKPHSIVPCIDPNQIGEVEIDTEGRFQLSDYSVPVFSSELVNDGFGSSQSCSISLRRLTRVIHSTILIASQTQGSIHSTILERCENMIDYVKRLRLCIRWFQLSRTRVR
ncbi:unnamed protein product, partial [Arabidopsis halleri]